MTSETATFRPSSFRPDINEVFSGLDSEHADRLLTSFLNSRGENTVKSLLAAHYTSIFEERRRDKVFNRAVTIHTHLKPAQQTLLTEAYPGLALTFTQRTKHSHPFAHASRVCEFNNLLYERIRYDPNVDLTMLAENDWNVFVKDVGGDITNSISHSLSSYHSCSPIISDNSYDSSRHCHRLSYTLGRRIRDQQLREAVAKTLNTGATTVYGCRSLAQHCPIRAPFLMFLHSVYDMTQLDIADSFESAGALVGFASFIYSDEIMIHPHGELTDLGVWWRYTDYPTDLQWSPQHVMDFIQGDIIFGFTGDDGYNYRHKLANYKSHVTCMRFRSSNGIVINAELLEQRCGIQFIKYTRELQSASCGVPHTLNIRSMENKYIVSFYDTASLFSGQHIKPTKAFYGDEPQWLDSKRVTPVRFLVDRQPVDNTRSYLSAVKDNLKPNDVLNYMRNYMSRSVVNGTVVDSRLSVSPDNLGLLARAIYLQTYDSNYRGGKIVQQALHDIDVARRRYYFPWMPCLVNSDFLNLSSEPINTRSRALDVIIESCASVSTVAAYFLIRYSRQRLLRSLIVDCRDYLPRLYPSNFMQFLFRDHRFASVSSLSLLVGGFSTALILRTRYYQHAVTSSLSLAYIFHRLASPVARFLFPDLPRSSKYLKNLTNWKTWTYRSVESLTNCAYLFVPIVYAGVKYGLRYITTPPSIRPIDVRQFITVPQTRFTFSPRSWSVCNINIDYYVPSNLCPEDANAHASRFIKEVYGVDINDPDDKLLPVLESMISERRTRSSSTPSVSPQNAEHDQPDVFVMRPSDEAPVPATPIPPSDIIVPHSPVSLYLAPHLDHSVTIAEKTETPSALDAFDRVVIAADGMCCFRAAVVNRAVDIPALRSALLQRADPSEKTLIEELTSPNWGGTSFLEFHASISGVVYHIHHDNTITRLGSGSRIIHLEFSNSHYNLFVPVHEHSTSISPLITSFPPFHTDTILQQVSSYINVAPTPGKGYHYSGNMDHYCHDHRECVNNSFGRTLYALSHIDDSVFFIEKDNGMFDLALLNHFIETHSIHVRFHCIPLPNHYVLSVHRGFRSLVTPDDIKLLHSHLPHCPLTTKPLPAVAVGNIVLYCEKTLEEFSLVRDTPESDLIVEILDDKKDNNSDILRESYRASSRVISVRVPVDECRRLVESAAPSIFEAYFTANAMPTVRSVAVITCVVDPAPFLSVLSKHLPHVANKFLVNLAGGDIRDTYTPVIERTFGDRVRNCMEERRTLWHHNVEYTIDSLRHLHSTMITSHERAMPLITADAHFHLFDVADGRVLCGVGIDTSEVRWGWDGEKLINFERLTTSDIRKVTDSPYVSFNRHSILIQSYYHYEAVKRIDLSDFELQTNMQLIQGVPGAGKTEYILNHVNKDCQSLLLTLTRTAKEDMVRRASAKTRTNLRSSNLTICTFDSFMINLSNKGKRYDEVWFDEARLTHGGDWLWCAYLTRCKKMYVVGDEAQILYAERTKYIPKYVVPDVFVDSPIALSKSYRCPADIVRWMNSSRHADGSPLYGFTVTTTSTVMHSVSTNFISGVEQVTRVENAQYLVFTQNELQEMRNAGFSNTRTVHQYQGNQNSHIILVRLDIKDAKPLFHKISYMLVAFSRHTTSLQYLSVATNSDPILAQLNIIKAYSEQEIRLLGGGEVCDTYHKEIHLRGATTKAVYLYPKIVRYLNDRYGFGSFIPTSIKSHFKSVFDHHTSPLLCDDAPDFRMLLQDFSDHLFFTEADVNYDHILYHSSDKTYIGEMSFIPLPQLLRERSYARPLIRTSIRKKVPPTQTQLVKAFCERNGAVPMLEGDVHELEMAKLLFDTVMSVCSPEIIERATESNITLNANSLTLWLSKQPEIVRRQILSDSEDLLDKDLTVYAFTLKGNAKPDLDRQPESRYKSAQTIAFQDKLINSFFCPAMADFTDRIMASLDDNIILFNRMSVEDYCSSVNRVCPWERFQVLTRFYEIDFSKFDKSQDLIALLFEVMLMEKFGMPRDLLNLWITMHKTTVLRDVKNRFRSNVTYQRKSGDAGTWVLNTLFQMAVVIHALGLSEKIVNGSAFCTFSGDDSLVFLDRNHISDSHISHSCAILFNLEVKLLRHSTPYFCSKFFIPTPTGLLFVPDVVKTIVKLGRKDLVNVEHAAEYYTSFCDNNSPLNDAYNWHLISHCINDRYHITGEHTLVFRALCTIMRDRSKFLSLWDYSDTAGVTILPNLDI